MTCCRLPNAPQLMFLLRCALALSCAAPAFAQLQILTTTLPQAAVGRPYTATLSAAGGFAPYRWTTTGGLPPGLSVQSGGTITGTSTAAGSYSFTVIVFDTRNAGASKVLTIGVTRGLSIMTANPLPAGAVDRGYSISLEATGGVSPYSWTASTLPPGLTLSSQTGILSGSPVSSGAFSIVIQVSDAAQATATATLSLTINPKPLEITTVPPLFSGTVGTRYSQTFSAVGGTPPYLWSLSSGSAGDLALDSATGTLRGTPQTAGTFSFTVAVTDAAGARDSRNFSLFVTPPLLTIVVGAALPSGLAGTPYSQKTPVVASGGTPPYRWSVSGGVAPGLDFDPGTLMITGSPATAGSFSFLLVLSDSANQTASKTLAITIRPAALSIASSRQLPDAALNASYAVTLVAEGGAPPYTWSAAGLPDGLHIDSGAGTISGVPMAAGTFPVAITLGDATLGRYVDRFTLEVKLPAAPPILLSGLPDAAEPANEYSIQVALASSFPAPITGQAILTFAPESGPGDRTVQFASGGTIANFSIPTGATSAVSDFPLAIQTGTVCGTINISVRLQAGGIDITPLPGTVMTTRISRGSPVITDVRVSRAEGKISLVVSGFSTSREVTQVNVAFTAANGQTLQAAASSITIPVEALFSAWFQDPANGAYGSQFVLTQPFTVQGDVSAVIPESVTLTNRLGSTTHRLP